MTSTIDPAMAVGMVTLSVANLERSLDYYQNTIGLKLLERACDGATLGTGTTPLLRLHAVPGARLVRRATGLYHFALRVPTRADLARVIVHFATSRTPVSGASDHLVSEALYLSDPDGHGIEIYRDRPRSEWYDANNTFRMDTLPLDIDGILAELGDTPSDWEGLPPGTDMGHIHLQVADIRAAERFYLGVLGLDRMIAMPSASFISAGGYHHHIGMNTWAGVGVPPPPAGAAHLLSYELLFSSEESLQPVLERIKAAQLTLEQQGESWSVQDPSHITVLLHVASNREHKH